MIRDLKLFSQEEQVTILRAIYYHDDRHQRHGEYEEVVKDAIVLQKYFQTPNNQVDSRDSHRLQQVLGELAIPYSNETPDNNTSTEFPTTSNFTDKRQMLADIAELPQGRTLLVCQEISNTEKSVSNGRIRISIKTSELAGMLHLSTIAVDKLESHCRYDIPMAYIDSHPLLLLAVKHCC